MSELSDRIRDHQQRQEAARKAQLETLRETEHVAARVPGAWDAAGTALHLATIEGNKDFEVSGLPNFFRFQPLPQPEAGNHAKVMLYHLAHRGGLSLSERTITATYTGRVIVDPPVTASKLGTGPYAVEEMDQSSWAVLLADIYDADCESK